MKAKGSLFISFAWLAVLVVNRLEGGNWVTSIPYAVGIVFFFCSYLYYRRKESEK